MVETFPRSSPEVAAELRRLGTQKDYFHPVTYALALEAAQHIEGLIVGLTEAAKVFGKAAQEHRQGYEAFKIGVGWQERALAAEANAKMLQDAAADFSKVACAFAKFDGEDWDFLLGEGEYRPPESGYPHIGYKATGRGGRERVWQEALKILREVVEAAEPKEESPGPTALSVLFVDRWAASLPPQARLELALALDQRVAEQMLKDTE